MAQYELSEEEYAELQRIRKEKKQKQLSDTINGRIPASNDYNKGHIRNWLRNLEPELLEKILADYNVPQTSNNNIEDDNDLYDVDDGINGPATAQATPFPTFLIGGQN